MEHVVCYVALMLGLNHIGCLHVDKCTASNNSTDTCRAEILAEITWQAR